MVTLCTFYDKSQVLKIPCWRHSGISTSLFPLPVPFRVRTLHSRKRQVAFGVSIVFDRSLKVAKPGLCPSGCTPPEQAFAELRTYYTEPKIAEPIPRIAVATIGRTQLRSVIVPRPAAQSREQLHL